MSIADPNFSRMGVAPRGLPDRVHRNRQQWPDGWTNESGRSPTAHSMLAIKETVLDLLEGQAARPARVDHSPPTQEDSLRNVVMSIEKLVLWPFLRSLLRINPAVRLETDAFLASGKDRMQIEFHYFLCYILCLDGK